MNYYTDVKAGTNSHSDTQSVDREAVLHAILIRFNKGIDKIRLANDVQTVFYLARSTPFDSQLERLLNRELTNEEAFKLKTLYHAFKYHKRSSGGHKK